MGLSFFAFFLFTVTIPDNIVFSDPSVIIAQTPIWHAIPLAMTISLSSVAIFSSGITNKQPIFGNRRFKPRWDQPVLKTYPIFSKEFKENFSEKSKRKCKIIALTIVIFLLVSIAVLPLGFAWRQTVDSDYYFSSRNCFNKETHRAGIEDAKHMSIAINSTRNGYYIEVKFSFDNKKYTFPLGCFSDDISDEEALYHLLYLKSLFEEDEFTVSKAYRVPALIEDNNFDQAEAALIYQLFDYK